MPIVSAAPDGASNHNMTMGRGHRSPRWGSLAHVCYLARLWRLSVGGYANTDLADIVMVSFDVGHEMQNLLISLSPYPTYPIPTKPTLSAPLTLSPGRF